MQKSRPIPDREENIYPKTKKHPLRRRGTWGEKKAGLKRLDRKENA